MDVQTKVSHIGYLKKGESVGYHSKFIASKPTTYAVIGIGYGDGCES